MKTQIGTCALVLVLATFGGSASAQDREIVWTERAESTVQAQLAQEQFLLTLFNTGRLPFKEVPMDTRTTLEQVMRAEGAWVGPMTEQVASMLCEVNRDHCDQDSKEVEANTLANQSKHVGGTRSTDLRWTVGKDETVRIPDLRIAQVWKPEPADKGAKVEATGIKIIQNCLTDRICIDDYVPQEGANDRLGRFRGVKVATRSTDGSGLALRLVPQLNAVVSVSEAPLADYEEIVKDRAIRFDFNDNQFEKLNQSLSRGIVGGVQLRLEHGHDTGALSGFESEPLAPHTKDVFDSFCNRAVHGECPIINTDGLASMAVAIVDQVPIVDDELILSHCDLGKVSIIRLSDRVVLEHQAGLDDPNFDCSTVVLPHQVLPEHHGTHVLGMLAAERNNRGISGLLSGLPNLSFVVIPFDSVRADQGDSNFAIDIAQAIDAAIFEQVKVFNLSFSYSPPQNGGKDEIRDRIKKWEDHALFVVAGGKEGDDANEGPCETRPACFAESLENVISVVGLETVPDTVALLENLDEPGKFLTNFGDKNFMLGAPARNIVSTVGTSSFGPATGTSQAAPQVTAAAVLLMSRGNVSPKKVRERLIYSSRLSLDTIDQINGGALDATATLMKDRDQVQLIDGCRITGSALDLRREVGGNLDQGSFDLTFLSGPQLSLRLRDVRRMFFRNNRGIFFHTLNGTLKREIATFTNNPEKHLLRLSVKSFSDECADRFAVDDLATIKLSEIADFISRMQ
ncbi:S8 family serine peptidase [Ruegeria atlantica]|uniref:S8 family serine peptidase n=1 Tax=Ruegeria atlantica TaxID=81569 RepID=UPI0024951674|nr:S8 family serine peptidase [Ruegeria atlantica]